MLSTAVSLFFSSLSFFFFYINKNTPLGKCIDHTAPLGSAYCMLTVLQCRYLFFIKYLFQVHKIYASHVIYVFEVDLSQFKIVFCFVFALYANLNKDSFT